MQPQNYTPIILLVDFLTLCQVLSRMYVACVGENLILTSWGSPQIMLNAVCLKGLKVKPAGGTWKRLLDQGQPSRIRSTAKTRRSCLPLSNPTSTARC